MLAYVIVGMTGQGKSRYVKNLISSPDAINTDCLVFDVNNEYGETMEIFKEGRIITVPSLNLNPDTTQFRSRFISPEMDINKFLDIALTKEYCNIVFEESTLFFMGRTEPKVRQLIVGKRWKRNNLFFLFHSLRTIPPVLLTLCNYVVLFKTGDSEKDVIKKDDRLHAPFMKMRNKQGVDATKPVIIEWVQQ